MESQFSNCTTLISCLGMNYFRPSRIIIYSVFGVISGLSTLIMIGCGIRWYMVQKKGGLNGTSNYMHLQSSLIVTADWFKMYKTWIFFIDYVLLYKSYLTDRFVKTVILNLISLRRMVGRQITQHIYLKFSSKCDL